MRISQKVAQIGWDCHRKFSTASLRDARGRVVARERFDHTDRPRLRERLRSWPAQTPVVLEASFGWSWVADELAAADLVPRLASSRKVAAWRTARGLAKSNRLDSDLLSELPSETINWWEVWLPPRAVREERELLRYRLAMVQVQTALKNRIHAILHRAGLVHEFTDLFGQGGRRFLQGLVATDVLPPSGSRALKGYLQLLDHLRLLIAQVTREFRRQVQVSPTAQRLRTLPGVSWILAYTLLAEIGDVQRFRRAKQLVSYSLLAPRADDSGHDDGSNPIGRHVGRCGRRMLKWAWIEAAHSAVRKDPFLRAVFLKRTDNGRRNRSQGYVAVARRLCVIAYALWKNEVDYTLEPPLRPGSRRRRCVPAWKKTAHSCPGTGQPGLAMVPVAAPLPPQASE